MTDRLWRHILELKAAYPKSSDNSIVWYTNEGFVFQDSDAVPRDGIVALHCAKTSFGDFFTEPLFGNDFSISYPLDVEKDLVNTLKTYCPLILAKVNKDKPFVIVHMAQTMDGKISTNSGKSKWIGNQENLVHAHRIRALVDGVLVGGKTIENDLPKLNVRHVEGKNPMRILFSNNFSNWDQLPKVENAKTILIRQNDIPIPKNHPIINEVISYSCDSTDKLNKILAKLKTKGINTLLIEGGATTAGSFISAGLVDVIQFHIAPMIFGSGKSCLNLPEINEVKEGCELSNLFSTSVGNAIMITGELVNK